MLAVEYFQLNWIFEGTKPICDFRSIWFQSGIPINLKLIIINGGGLLNVFQIHFKMMRQRGVERERSHISFVVVGALKIYFDRVPSHKNMIKFKIVFGAWVFFSLFIQPKHCSAMLTWYLVCLFIRSHSKWFFDRTNSRIVLFRTQKCGHLVEQNACNHVRTCTVFDWMLKLL